MVIQHFDRPADDEVRAARDRICADPLFSQAERLKRLLCFAVDETLAGRSDSLKEHTLGVNVFDRGLSYDPATDPTARVYMARLRSKLIEYYATSGKHDAVIIDIPKGGYTPVFKRADVVPAMPPAPSAPPPTPFTHRRVSWMVAAALATLVVALGAYVFSRTPRPAPSVAVLPFVNMSPVQETEYYSDGLSEEIINALSQLPGLRVVARTSTFQFKGKSQDVWRIGKQLNVGAVLEGSVRRDGTSLRVTAQLIETTSGYHLWSDTYDRSIDQIFTTQNDIARSVARTLRATLVDGEQPLLVHRPTESLDAYDLYLKGRYAWNRWTDVGFEKAIAFFAQAVAADRHFSPAYAGLANCYSLLALYGVIAPRDALPKADTAAAMSIALDDGLAEGHSASGLVNYLLKWDRDGGERELRRALALNPGYADAHHFYSHVLLLAGRVDDSLSELQTARALDPLSLVLRSDIGWTYYLTRQTARAESESRETLALDPSFNETLYNLGITYIQAGRPADAIDALEKARSQFATQQVLGALGYAYARAGRQGDARALVAGLERASRDRYVAASSIAIVHVALGEADRAFQWLDRAVGDRDPFLLLIDVDSLFDPIRADPRFAAIRNRVVLPEAAK
jgi:TolB-like protein/Flp pilus assembly protein TadD